MIASSLLHARFVSILPRIQHHGFIYFRHVRCRQKRADCIAEMVALAWKWFIRLAQKGRDACRFPSVLATFAARAVRSGRRLAGQINAKDIMNEQNQQRRGYVVGKLPDHSTLNTNPLNEALIDNTVSPVPDQVQFRLDFPAWLKRHSRRDRKIAVEMAKGEQTKRLAHRFNLSPGRVSQLRRQFQHDWQRFTDDQAATIAS